MTNKFENIVQEIDEKYKAINQNTEAHLEGLLCRNQLHTGIIYKQMRC
jgi:hypothetical protein